MSNFRTKLFGLAGIAMAFSGMAYGQITCPAALGAVAPILVRGEGTTEQLPAITITCTNTTGVATTAASVNIQDFTSLPVTSKVLNTTSGQTEAELQVNGAVPVSGAYGTVSGTSINWTVPIPIVAPAGTVIFTIYNVRVNANGAVATTGAPTPVTEQLFITGPAAVITASAPAASTVAYVENGLAASKNFSNAVNAAGLTTATFATSGSNNFVTCTGSSLANGQNLGLATTVLVSENFATAFKTNVAGGPPSSPVSSEQPEQPIAAGAAGAAGIANTTNSATRFQLSFSNVPSGATIYVPTVLAANTAGGDLNASVATLTSSATGAFSAVPATTASTSNGLLTSTGVTGPSYNNVVIPVAALSISGGTGSAVYEITGSDQTSIATFPVPVYIYAAANTITASSTALGITISFAPTGSTNIPNFTSTSSSTTLTSSVYSLCTTSLLFPFVTNQVGFDTGVSIANTSTDPFGSKLGAVPQSGTCTLNFYGNGAPTPSAVTGPNVPTGTSYTFQLSSVAPGFQGYIIAQCNFQFAHAFAFATNGATAGNAGTAFSYLAGVIPNGTANARLAGNGEGLGQ